MAKRNTQFKADDYFRLDMHSCYRWCLHNGININPEPVAVNRGTKHRPNYVATGEIEIVINNNGAITRSPKKYTKKEVYKKIWELYCHFYDTNN